MTVRSGWANTIVQSLPPAHPDTIGVQCQQRSLFSCCTRSCTMSAGHMGIMSKCCVSSPRELWAPKLIMPDWCAVLRIVRVMIALKRRATHKTGDECDYLLFASSIICQSLNPSSCQFSRHVEFYCARELSDIASVFYCTETNK